ncbi:cytokine receptor-like [Amphibalanus amphitrite]|uniref:cytokine receptor-like n=1 Tax=Amphibalanus amphitrite TaxID=1232801 RepID=UPI001C90F673|nr:cytokine receptor-like [Amphibalanus amphitrite]XP_043227243.1 cytokine receptor-like [Amphibalanus amphitrite]XP_043227245.1 cytokine receptor-like [Amphibalanus amphitrite]
MRLAMAAPGRWRPPACPWLLSALLLLSGFTRSAALSCMGDDLNGMGTTYPSQDINVRPNTEFSITCQIDPAHPKVAGYTANDLYFTRSEELAVGGFRRTEVAADNYEVLNSTMLRLTDRLERRARYSYACRLRHKTTPTLGICTNNVNIGDPPLPVEGFRCVSQNWQAVNCTWREPFNAIRTRYEPEYRTMTRIARYRKPCNITAIRRPLRPGQTRTVSCLVSENNFRFSHETFRMVMNAYNELGNASSDFVLSTYEIVRPAPPVRVWGTNLTTSSVRLRAEIGHPMASFPRPIDFSVEYTSRWNQTPQPVDASAMQFMHNSKHTKGRNTTNDTLVSGLLPNTDYRFAVRMRSSMADVVTYPDLWSPPLETVLRTQATVPAASPRTTLGSFDLVGRATSRTVYVYWQQIEAQEQNGPQFGYCAVRLRPGRAAATPDNTTDAYALFRDLDLGRHEFSIAACNSEGKSAEPATLVVPEQEDVLPRPHPVTLVAEAPGSYTLAWEQKADTPVDNYTLFWCQHMRDRPFQCEGQLNWTVVDGSLRNHSLRLPATAEYQFAVAANRGAASSGMVWSRCVLLASGERTQQLDSVSVQSRGATEMTLTWPDYCPSLAMDGVSYKVYYCASHEGQCLPGAAGEEQSVVHPAGERRSTVRVPGLAPYTEYRLQVAVLSGAVEGQRSHPPVVDRTLSARPEPPTITQVSALNSSAVHVSWAAPARPNGQLTQYQLKQIEPAGGDTVSLPASTKAHTVVGLQPYRNYKFRLSVCNKADCSAWSAAVTGRTLAGRPGHMEPPRTQLLNASAVRVSWRPPTVPGGPRPVYTLRTVSERRGVNTTTDQTLLYSATDGGRLVAELAVPECEPGSSQRHLFAIRASVTVSPAGRLDGPWSPLTEQQCVLVSDWPTATIVGVVVGGALLMMFVVLLFFLLCHRTKRKLSEMRNLGVNMPAGLDRPEKAHGFPGGPDSGYGRLVSQSSGTTDRTAASVSGQPLLQEDLTREECDGEGSELTPAVNTDSNSCSSSATNYTDSGAECDKVASSPTYSKFRWPVPAAPPKPQLAPYVQAAGPELPGAAAAAGSAPPYTKFSPYVDAKAIQALVARGRSMESLPAGEPSGDLSRSEPDLSGAAAGPPPPYSQIGHRSSTGYVSMPPEDGLPAAARLGSPPPAAGCAKPCPAAADKSAERNAYVALGPPPQPSSVTGFPPYVLAGPPPGEAPPAVGGCSPAHAAAAAAAAASMSVPTGTAGAPPAWASARLADGAPEVSSGYVQHDKMHPQMELHELAAGAATAESLAAAEPVLSPKKLPTVATARDPYCRVVTSHQGAPDLGPNVSMV